MNIAIKAHLLDYHTPNRIEKGKYHHTQWEMKEIPQKNDCQRMLVLMDDTWPITRNPSPKKSIAPDCRQRKAHWKRYFSAHQSTITIGSFQKALAFMLLSRLFILSPMLCSLFGSLNCFLHQLSHSKELCQVGFVAMSQLTESWKELG